MSKYIIYSLVNPINESIFYIGLSSSGLRRPKHHFYPSVLAKSNYKVHKTIKRLLKQGINPRIEILEECSSKEELNSVEKYYIKLYKKEGEILSNLTNGGGGTCGRIVSQKQRQYLSNKYKGRKHAESTKRKISEAKRGIKLDKNQKYKRILCNSKRMLIKCVETGERFISIRQAALVYKCDHRGLARCCKGIYKKYKNRTWQYLENEKTN